MDSSEVTQLRPRNEPNQQVYNIETARDASFTIQHVLYMDSYEVANSAVTKERALLADIMLKQPEMQASHTIKMNVISKIHCFGQGINLQWPRVEMIC